MPKCTLYCDMLNLLNESSMQIVEGVAREWVGPSVHICLSYGVFLSPASDALLIFD